MNYLQVPDSKLKLVDGNVVMLDRFPGLKWILHNGWYNYNGRQYSGWYFISIPSQTILPVSNQDLRMITLVSSKSNDAYPEYPAPPAPPHHHRHGDWPEPGPCPRPIYPPVAPDPEPEKPAFFSQTYKKQLDEAFISVPTLKKRDELDTSKLPDGKIVRVNSVDGITKYYAWSAFNDHWEELNFALKEDLEEALEDYYTSTQINEYLEGVNGRIDDVNTLLAETAETLQNNINNVDNKVGELSESTTERIESVKADIVAIQADIEEIREELDHHSHHHDSDVDKLDERVTAIEAAVFDIQKISELLTANTVLVSQNGGIKDSGVSIGNDEIGEPSEYASLTTLATEKAVAKKVEDAQPKWASF